MAVEFGCTQYDDFINCKQGFMIAALQSTPINKVALFKLLPKDCNSVSAAVTCRLQVQSQVVSGREGGIKHLPNLLCEATLCGSRFRREQKQNNINAEAYKHALDLEVTLN